MNSLRLAIALCSLLLLIAVAYSQTQLSDTRLTTNPVFINNCAKCHGTNAKGRHFRGPSLISSKVETTSADELRAIINRGKGHMPQFASKITPEEIDALVQQVRALNKQ